VKVLQQVKWEQKQFWRNPPAAVFTFVFPLMFLLIFSSLYGNDRIEQLGNVKFVQQYVPAIVAFGLISACYTNLAFTLSLRRAQGILKRKRGTPLSVFTYMGGIIGNVVIIAALLTVVTIIVGIVGFGISFPEFGTRVFTLAVVLLVGAFCFSACGIMIANIVPNEEAAPAIINIILFPLLFISGAFSYVDNDTALAKVAAFFPVRHLIQACQSVFLPPPQVKGAGWEPKHLIVMLAWGIGATLVAARTFKWEPNTDGGGGGRRSRRRAKATSAS
jgi:ABC-2 type transport system permease protein